MFIKISTLILILSAFSGNVNSQYGSYHVKEQFDYVYTHSYQNGSWSYDNYEDFIPDVQYIAPNPDKPLQKEWTLMNSNNAGFNLSSVWAPAMEGLLTMYETTNDKAYLYAYMREATKIIRSRRDNYFGSNYDPLWFRLVNDNGKPDDTGNGVSAVFNGRILMSMAHFNYILKMDYALRFTDIELYGTEDRNVIYNGAQQFEDFRLWVQSTVEETLDWAIQWNSAKNRYNFWYESGCYNKKGIPHNYANTSMGEFNYQTPWAIAFMYMYLSDQSGNYNYGVKAVQLAQLILGSDCSSPNFGALQLTSNQAYYWDHNPWSLGEIFKEDIGHATWDIWFPILYNRYKSDIYNHVTTGQYFEDYHLLRFRNTFSQSIWDNTSGGVEIGVNGVTGSGMWGIWNDYVFNDYRTRTSSMAWMPLYVFDDESGAPSPNVYDAIMDFYGNFVDNQAVNGNNFAGMKMKGLADVVTAHWDKECYSLYLDNRECYFDQDFYAKHNLYVGYTGNSYFPLSAMGNTGYSGGLFIIRPGVTVNFVAQNHVYIGSNFFALPGSSYTVTSHENPCPAEDGGGNVERISSLNQPGRKTNPIGVTAFPNPTSEILNVKLENVDFDSPGNVKLIGSSGKEVNTMRVLSKTPDTYILDVSTVANGSYMVLIQNGSFTSYTKIIVKH